MERRLMNFPCVISRRDWLEIGQIVALFLVLTVGYLFYRSDQHPFNGLWAASRVEGIEHGGCFRLNGRDRIVAAKRITGIDATSFGVSADELIRQCSLDGWSGVWHTHIILARLPHSQIGQDGTTYGRAGELSGWPAYSEVDARVLLIDARERPNGVGMGCVLYTTGEAHCYRVKMKPDSSFEWEWVVDWKETWDEETPEYMRAR